MAKVIVDKLALDKEVTALVSRVGAMDNPGMYISKYSVAREPGAPTWVTVTFLADEEFCKEEK